MPNQASPLILFVDDDAFNRRVFTHHLRDAGFRTAEAATGADALRQAAGPEPTDLVILDINLPDLDGREVCRRLKDHPATAGVPVVQLSGVYVRPQERAHALEGGADAFLTKPAEPDELIATVRALLRIRKAEEVARAAVRDWQATFEAIHDALFVLDARDVVVRCNRAATALLDRPAEFLIGRPCRNLFGEAFGVEGEKLFDDATAVEPVKEAHLAERWYRVSADEVPGAAGPSGRVLLIEDVTARRTLEERLRQAHKLEAVGRLAGGVAHEFNNLLTAMTSHLALALQTLPADDPRHESLQAAESAAWRAADLTRQLLGFSRRAELRAGPTDLNGCVREAVGLLRATLGHRIRLETSYAAGLWRVRADASQIVQVLMNLCLNARDAMPQGGVLFVETSNVSLGPVEAAAQAGEYVRLRVRDTGQGIAPDVLPRIFDPFFTTKEIGKGTGLGLAVAYGVVQEHGGWLQCRSSVGEGACFDVFLPRLNGG
jgi:PAS domain S-box-containing protein